MNNLLETFFITGGLGLALVGAYNHNWTMWGVGMIMMKVSSL